MVITVNGKSKELTTPATVAGLLDILNLDPTRVAIELNRDIIPRAEFAVRQLADGDTLEIVQFVGGG